MYGFLGSLIQETILVNYKSLEFLCTPLQQACTSMGDTRFVPPAASAIGLYSRTRSAGSNCPAAVSTRSTLRFNPYFGLVAVQQVGYLIPGDGSVLSRWLNVKIPGPGFRDRSPQLRNEIQKCHGFSGTRPGIEFSWKTTATLGLTLPPPSWARLLGQSSTGPIDWA
jgi:hypothetical protein